MKRTTELIAEPGERVEVLNFLEPNSWLPGVVECALVAFYKGGEQITYRVRLDGGPSAVSVDQDAIRKPQAACSASELRS